jgi:N-acetylmuramoyl-L-alanine amidase
MPHDIFISYSRKDRERVRLIAEELARRGYDVWWDPRLRGGQDFRDAIEEALKSARCVMVAWSRHSLESDFVIDEAERGKQRGILLPVFIDAGIGPPLGFGGIHTNDISGWLADPSRPEQVDQLADDLADLLGRPAVAGVRPTYPPAPPPGLHRAPVHRAADARRTAMLGAAGLIVLLAAGGIVYSMSNPPSRSVAEIARDTTRADSSRAAPGDTLPVLSGPRTGMLVGLRCALPGESRNPLGERAERLAPAAYRVNTEEHVLVHADGQPVRLVQAASVGTTLQSRRVIVAHHTAAPARAAESYLENPDRSASAHLLIHRDGSVTQLVPFDIRAFHAGRSRWKDLENLNSHSIGIEMENLGSLAQRDGAWYFGGTLRVPADSVERLAGSTGQVGGWHGYPDAQLRAFFHVSCALRRAYPTLEDVVGHEDIALPVGSKVDPGPAFPLDALRRRLFPARAPA